MPYSPCIDISSLWEQSDSYSWRYCISKNWGIQKVLSRMQLMCLSSHWQFIVCIFWWFTPVSDFKASDNWWWRYCISKIWGIQYRHECSCSSARSVKLHYQRSAGGYLPSYMYEVVLQCIGSWQCYATLKSSRTDTHIHTQTDTHTDRQTASMQ